MWPCVALDGSTWPYRLGSRPFREARRDPAWPCAAPDGLAPVQTCPTPGRRRVPRRCRLPFGRLRATKPVVNVSSRPRPRTASNSPDHPPPGASRKIAPVRRPKSVLRVLSRSGCATRAVIAAKAARCPRLRIAGSHDSHLAGVLRTCGAVVVEPQTQLDTSACLEIPEMAGAIRHLRIVAALEHDTVFSKRAVEVVQRWLRVHAWSRRSSRPPPAKHDVSTARVRARRQHAMSAMPSACPIRTRGKRGIVWTDS